MPWPALQHPSDAGTVETPSFNPHPTRRLGAISNNSGCSGDRPHTSCFNPHPTRRLGAIRHQSQRYGPRLGFNPHPTRRLGAYHMGPVCHLLLACFNPHPTRRLGAIGGFDSAFVARLDRVSILTQPEGWVPYLQFDIETPACIMCNGFNPHPTRRLGAICVLWRREIKVRAASVSILTQPEGWVPWPTRWPWQPNASRFQSSPNPKVGCHKSFFAGT